MPHTITHLQFVVPSDIPRFKQLGVIAAFQLLWASANPEAIELVKPYIDPAVYVWQYPARSMLNAGATISGASDWFVSNPDECMPREAMLYAYTRNSARAMNQLEKIGSIAPGKEADFVVVDRDVLTISADELSGTKILQTILGGKTVYEAKQ